MLNLKRPATVQRVARVFRHVLDKWEPRVLLTGNIIRVTALVLMVLGVLSPTEDLKLATTLLTAALTVHEKVVQRFLPRKPKNDML